MKERMLIEPVVLADALAVSEDFRCTRIFFAGSMAGFLQQRHVDHRCGVALRAGVAVPVPGAAEVAAFFNDAHIAHAGLDQSGCRGQPSKAPANEGKGDMVGARCTGGDRRIGVFQVVGEGALDFKVLRIAIRPQALVALFQVFSTQGVLVEGLSSHGVRFRWGLRVRHHGQLWRIVCPSAPGGPVGPIHKSARLSG